MARREIIAMNAARSAGLPSTQGSRRRAVGRPTGIIAGLDAGPPLKHEFSASPWRAWTCGHALGRTQAAITKCRRRPICRTRCHGSSGATRTRFCEIACAHSPQGTEACFTLTCTIERAGRARRCDAVLDWANARTGDPRADPRAHRLHSPIWIAGSISRGRLRRSAQEPRGWLAPRLQRGHWARERMAPFYAWAGMVMVRDLEPRRGTAGLAMAHAGFSRAGAGLDCLVGGLGHVFLVHQVTNLNAKPPGRTGRGWHPEERIYAFSLTSPILTQNA
jgi:hypothetical protein